MQLAIVEERLSATNAIRRCECGGTYMLSDALLSMPVIGLRVDGVPISDNEIIFAVMLVCGKCGHARTHVLDALGINPMEFARVIV